MKQNTDPSTLDTRHPTHDPGTADRMKAIVAAIHGILTSQTDPSWPDRFDAWMLERDPEVKVLKKEYRAGPFPWWNCWVKDPLLARGLANELELFLGDGRWKMEDSEHRVGSGSPLPIRLGEGLGVRSCEKIGPHAFPLSSLRGRRGPGRGGFSFFSHLLTHY